MANVDRDDTNHILVTMQHISMQETINTNTKSTNLSFDMPTILKMSGRSKSWEQHNIISVLSFATQREQQLRLRTILNNTWIQASYEAFVLCQSIIKFIDN